TALTSTAGCAVACSERASGGMRSSSWLRSSRRKVERRPCCSADTDGRFGRPSARFLTGRRPEHKPWSAGRMMGPTWTRVDRSRERAVRSPALEGSMTWPRPSQRRSGGTHMRKQFGSWLLLVGLASLYFASTVYAQAGNAWSVYGGDMANTRYSTL